MKRPLLCLTMFYIFGIIIGQYIMDKRVIVLFFIPIIFISILLYKKYKWKGVFVFPVSTLAGFIILIINIMPSNNFIETIAQNTQNIKIYGIVKDIDYTSTGRQKIIVNTNSIITEQQQTNTNLNIQAILDLDVEVKYNQMVLLSGELQCFDFPRNPGGFDEKLYMQTKRIDYKIFAKLIQTGDIINNIDNYLYKIHQKLNYVYDSILPQKEASVLKAMLLGDKKSLDTSIKEVYRKAGISHILAISGLHISILSGILWFLLNLSGFSKRINSVIILTILIFYCIFTGNSVSTVRAVSMIGIILIGTIIYREADIYTSISAVALALLIYQPLYLYDVGFQLSFGAVIGIIVLTPILERLYYIPKIIKPYLMSTLAAALTTYPVMAYHFNIISPIGILINIFVLPFAAILVGFGLLAGILGTFSIIGGKFLCGIIYFILVLYEKICIIGANISLEIVTGEPNIILILIYYVTLLIIAYYYYNTKEKRIILKKYIITTITSFIVLGSVIIFKPKKLEVVYLDVNQGDSIAIHTKDNKNILIDGGGNIRKEIGEANTGSQIVLPYLKYKGIDTLDCVFISHPDGDHILGIIELIDYINIKQIIVADTNNIYTNELFISLAKKAKQHSVPILKMSSGDKIDLKNSLSIECIYPFENTYSDSYNNSSLVIYMKYNNINFVFTGDIEKEAENSIIEKYNLLDGQVLKVPHHGSKTSSTQMLLDNVKPKVAIISSGRNNSYGHPHKEVLDRYKNINAKIYNTADEGAVIITTDRNSLHISTMRERKSK